MVNLLQKNTLQICFIPSLLLIKIGFPKLGFSYPGSLESELGRGG